MQFLNKIIDAKSFISRLFYKAQVKSRRYPMYRKIQVLFSIKNIVRLNNQEVTPKKKCDN
jgi:hypothetical protein